MSNPSALKSQSEAAVATPVLPTAEPASLLVVIVCYRAADLTIDCLRSLEPEVAALPGAHVAVCENGTGEESVRALREAIQREGWDSWVSLKAIYPNRGFSGGNNVILRDALAKPDPPDYVLLLNADRIVRPGALKTLLRALRRRPDVGIVGPRLEGVAGEPQVSCFRHFTLLTELVKAARTGPITRLFKTSETPIHGFDEPLEPDWISSACVLVRRGVLEGIGTLDEGYYLYFDGAEYCRRARRAGWHILYCPQARVVHLAGRSNPVVSLAARRKRRPAYWYASRSRYYAKYYGRSGLWLVNVLWLIGRCVSKAREVIGSKISHTCAQEWQDIWTNCWAPLTFQKQEHE